METNSQLIKKIKEGGYNNVYPIAYIDGIIDKESNEKLSDILIRYNNIMVPWQGDVASTRNRVPSLMRRQGIVITYITDLSEIVTEVYKGTVEDIKNNWADNINWELVPDLKFVQGNASKLPDGTITPEKLSPALQELISQSGSVVNMPDDEDLEQKDMVLKFKDRPYNSELASGKGYKILRKNWTNVGTKTINLLTQDILNQSNTIYEIRYDFDLNSQEITIPEGCVLKFNGGSFKNGTLNGNDTLVSGKRCLSSVSLKGSYSYFNLSTLSENTINLSSLHSIITESNRGTIFDIPSLNVKVDTSDPILLSKGIDFKNTIINIENNFGPATIFKAENTFSSITVSKEALDGKDFSSIVEDDRKTYLLNVYDGNRWCYRGDEQDKDIFTRRDLIYIVNGQAFNNVISTYNNSASSPVASIVDVTNSSFNFCNASFTFSGTYACTLLMLKGRDKCLISDININVINTDLAPSSIFDITDSANIEFSNCKFLNSYDDLGGSAYIFYLNNIYNVLFSNVIANSLKWGVMGGDNINTLTVVDSQINRVDIHCYGKTINIERTNFILSYNQFSGIFDYIKFKSCNFNNQTSILYEGTYKSWIKHDVFFEDCCFNNKQTISLYYTAPIADLSGQRLELQKAVLPNVYFKNCKFKSSYYQLFYSDSTVSFSDSFRLELDNTEWIANKTTASLLRLSNNDIIVEDSVDIIFKDVNLFGISSIEEIETSDIFGYWILLFRLQSLRPSNDKPTNIQIYDSVLPHLWYENNLNITCYNSTLYNVSYNRSNSVKNKFYDCNLYFTNSQDSTLTIDDSHIINCKIYQYNKALNLTPNKEILIQGCSSDTTAWNNFHYTDAISEKQYKDELLGCLVRDTRVTILNLLPYEEAPNWGSPYYNFSGNKYLNSITNELNYYIDGEWVSPAYNISGTFENKPVEPKVGTSYFCTDRQTSEGAVNGIMIYHKGKNIWVDALGRIVE